MICTYLCNIRMNGVFKPNRNQIWSRIENDNCMNCVYVYIHIHWTGYSKGAREEE